MKPYSVVFAGTPQFSCSFLQVLLEDENFSVKAVISQEDKPVGRKQIKQETAVKKLAKKYNTLIFQPKKIADITKEIKKIAPDFLVVVAYGQIIPVDFLKIASWNINVHGSLLPQYRGASPVQEALLKGDLVTGISIMNIAEKMDSGAVYKMRPLRVESIDTAKTLLQKLSELSVFLSQDLLEIAQGLKPCSQNKKQVSYCQKIQKKDAEIKFSQNSAQEIYNKMRAFDPWPGIFFQYQGKRIKILSGKIIKNFADGDNQQFNLEFGIKTIKDYFLPIKIIPEGKKEQTYLEWFRNNCQKPSCKK